MFNNYEDNNGYSPPEALEQNDNSSGCTTCRQKIAQQTFDMVVGGTSHGPLLDIMTQYQVPTIAIGGGLTVPQSPADYEVNVIDMLYGSRLPNYQQMNTIDALYGKGDETQYKDPFEPWKPFDINTTVSGIGIEDRVDPRKPKGGFIKEQKDCVKTIFNTFNFPGFQYFPDYYLKETVLNKKLITEDCKIIWEIDTLGERLLLDININSCCKKLIMGLWCSTTFSRTEYTLVFNDIPGRHSCQLQYEHFNICINNLIKGKIEEISNKYPPFIRETIEKILNESVEVRKQELYNSINIDFNSFTQHSYHIIKVLTSLYSDQNYRSCLCNSNATNPTYCCHPELNPSECYCPDGSLKNLCKECSDIRIKIEKIIRDNLNRINDMYNNLTDSIGIYFDFNPLFLFHQYDHISIDKWIEHINNHGFEIGFFYGGTSDFTEITKGINITHHDNSYFILDEIWLLFVYYLEWLEKFPDKVPTEDFFIMLIRQNSIDVISVGDLEKFFNSIKDILGMSKEDLIGRDKKILMDIFKKSFPTLLNNPSEENIKEIFSKFGLLFNKFKK